MSKLQTTELTQQNGAGSLRWLTTVASSEGI